MNLVWHIVKKDCRRHRGWIALWAAIVAAKVALGFIAFVVDILSENSRFMRVTQGYDLLLLIECILAYLLGLLWIQADPLVGTNQFWITRPISRGRMVVAKIAGLALVLIALPILITLPWWLGCGIGGRGIAVGASEIVVRHIALALPAMLIGAWTNSLARALLWTAVPTFMGIIFVGTVLSGSRVSPPLILVGPLLIVFVVGIPLVVRSVTRTYWPSAAAFVIAALAGWFLLPYGARALLSKEEPDERFAERAQSVAVEMEQPIVRPNNVRGPVNDRRAAVSVGFSVRGIPQGQAVTKLAEQHTWQWGPAESTRPPAERMTQYYRRLGGEEALRHELGLPPPATDPETERWTNERIRSRRQDAARPLPSRQRDTFLTEAWLAPSTLARMQAQAPSYRAKFWLQLSRPRLLHELPLRPTGWLRHDGGSLRIHDVVARKPGITLVTWIEARPASWLAGSVRVSARNWRLAPRLNDSAYILNRELGHVHLLTDSPVDRLRMNAVDLAWRASEVHQPILRRDGERMLWPNWLENAVFARVDFREEARFLREVAVERFLPQSDSTDSGTAK